MTSLCYHSMREFLPLVQEHLGCRCIHEIHSHLKATRARKMLLLLHSHCNCNVYSCCMTKTKIKGENSERHMLAFLSHIEKLLLTNLDSAEARWDIMLCYVMLCSRNITWKGILALMRRGLLTALSGCYVFFLNSMTDWQL